MEHSVDSFECNGYTVRIYQDTDVVDPRRDYDHLGTMVCFHRGYDLGDKHTFTLDELEEQNNVTRYLQREYDAFMVLPLYLYDHSGITMSTGAFSDPWDSGCVGFIYVTRAQILAEWKVKRISPRIRDIVRKSLLSEVEEYDDYLTGNVYGYVIGDYVESCWGFYGYDSVVEAAKDAAMYLPPAVDWDTYAESA